MGSLGLYPGVTVSKEEFPPESPSAILTAYVQALHYRVWNKTGHPGFYTAAMFGSCLPASVSNIQCLLGIPL